MRDLSIYKFINLYKSLVILIIILLILYVSKTETFSKNKLI